MRINLLTLEDYKNFENLFEQLWTYPDSTRLNKDLHEQSLDQLGTDGKIRFFRYLPFNWPGSKMTGTYFGKVPSSKNSLNISYFGRHDLQRGGSKTIIQLLGEKDFRASILNKFVFLNKGILNPSEKRYNEEVLGFKHSMLKIMENLGTPSCIELKKGKEEKRITFDQNP